MSRSEASLLGAINQARAAHGLAPLRPDSSLERAARAHSTDMLRRGYFAHGAFAARLLAFHARGARLAENLAWSTASAGAGAVVRMWLASPEHRANLLAPSLTRVGLAAPVGSFLGHHGVAVVTADFAG